MATLRAIVLALLSGAITYYVAHAHVGVTVAVGVLLAIVVAFASFVGVLVLAVGDLEARYRAGSETVTVLNQKIGAHRAIYAWVTGCETSLADPGMPVSAPGRAAQLLMYLEANVVNSHSPYAFYPSSHVDQVKAIASGQPDDDPLVNPL